MIELTRDFLRSVMMDKRLTPQAYRTLLFKEKAAEIVTLIQKDPIAGQAYVERLLQDAYTDPVTNVWNRKIFDEAIKDLMKGEKFEGAILIIDINKFKDINDNCGHQVGDYVLGAVANELQKKTRPTDLIARIGGDEFAILMRDISLQEAIARRDDVERKVNSVKHDIVDVGVLPIRVSIGVGAFNSEIPPSEAYVLADEDMYRRKKQSRILSSENQSTKGQVVELHLKR